MSISQNARFEVEAPADAEFSNPPGAGLARVLFQELRGTGWSTGDLKNWRDCGWAFTVSDNKAYLLIALARSRKKGESVLRKVECTLRHDEWMLQIVPQRSPGLITRLFGSKRSADRPDVFRLASSVREILKSKLNYEHPLWRRNGYPTESISSNEPEM